MNTLNTMYDAQRPEADSLNKKAVALHWQFVKARLLELINFFCQLTHAP